MRSLAWIKSHEADANWQEMVDLSLPCSSPAMDQLHKILRRALGLVTGCLIVLNLHLVAADLPSAAAPSLPGAKSTKTDQDQKSLQALPGAKTAADTFRELLAMNPGERAQALAGRSEFNRKYLINRLSEFEALPSEERELRLMQLELNCHLPDLMKLAPANRTKRMAAVPPDLRPLIEERLRQWDRLPENVQCSVLDHQTTANFFLRVRPGQVLSTSVPPLPGNEKVSQAAESVNRIFELPVKDRKERWTPCLPES